MTSMPYQRICGISSEMKHPGVSNAIPALTTVRSANRFQLNSLQVQQWFLLVSFHRSRCSICAGLLTSLTHVSTAVSVRSYARWKSHLPFSHMRSGLRWMQHIFQNSVKHHIKIRCLCEKQKNVPGIFPAYFFNKIKRMLFSSQIMVFSGCIRICSSCLKSPI